MVIRFLSKKVPNKDYREDYKLFYKVDPDKAFQKVDDEYLLLQSRTKLYLKIEYVDIDNLKLKNKHFTFHLENF